MHVDKEALRVALTASPHVDIDDIGKVTATAAVVLGVGRGASEDGDADGVISGNLVEIAVPKVEEIGEALTIGCL